jgi:hypothetical protein
MLNFKLRGLVEHKILSLFSNKSKVIWKLTPNHQTKVFILQYLYLLR